MKKVLALLFLAGATISCKEQLQMKVVVIEHNVTADRNGSRTYSTIVRAEDGNVDELIGLKWYAKPIGSSFVTNVYRDKK